MQSRRTIRVHRRPNTRHRHVAVELPSCPVQTRPPAEQPGIYSHVVIRLLRDDLMGEWFGGGLSTFLSGSCAESGKTVACGRIIFSTSHSPLDAAAALRRSRFYLSHACGATSKLSDGSVIGITGRVCTCSRSNSASMIPRSAISSKFGSVYDSAALQIHRVAEILQTANGNFAERVVRSSDKSRHEFVFKHTLTPVAVFGARSAGVLNRHGNGSGALQNTVLFFRFGSFERRIVVLVPANSPLCVQMVPTPMT